MGKHHKTKSPSSLPAKNQCIHYESGEAGLPARKGSILHKCFEYGAAGRSIPTSWSEMDKEDQAELLEGGVLLSDFAAVKAADLDGILWALEELEGIIRNLFDEKRTLAELVASGEARLERKVEVFGSDFAVITFGSLDFDFATLLVDLKTGRIRNYREQMLCYALAKMQETGLDEVLVVELYSRERRSIVYSVTRKEAEETIFDLSDRIDRKDEFPAQICEYCDWCKNSKPGGCSKIQELASMVQENREEFPKDISFRSSEVLKLAIGALLEFQQNPDDEKAREALDKVAGDLAFLYDAAKAAKSFLSGVENSIRVAIDEGIAIPGLEKSTTAGRASVNDPKALFSIVGLDQDSFLECVSVSLPEVSKRIGNAATVTRIFEEQGLAIPEDCLGKKGQLLKGKIPNALKFLLDEKGLIERGADSVSIKRKKPSSSLREGDELPEALQE